MEGVSARISYGLRIRGFYVNLNLLNRMIGGIITGIIKGGTQMSYKINVIFVVGILLLGCNDTNVNSPSNTMKLNLSYPNGGEVFTLSENPVTIKWTSENIKEINLYYSSTVDSLWVLIADSLDSGIGYFNWDILNIYPGMYKLKITDYKDESFYDLTDAPFILNNWSLSLTYPNGGEEIFISSIPVKVKWTSENIEKVNLYYSSANNSVWTVIADSIDGGTGYFDWNIRHNDPGMYQLKITDYKDENLNDATDGPFSFNYDPNIITVSKYYPLETGNRWVYRARYQQSTFPPYVDTTYSIERKIISDTCFENGDLYFKISETDYYRNNTKIYFERFDSANGNIYRRYTDNQFGDVLVDSLLAKVSDQFMGHRFTLPNSPDYMYTKFLISNLEEYFGVTRSAHKYREMDTYAFYDYFLVEDIGLGNYYQMLDVASRDATLKGCIINTVLYGDTTISY